jgi:hypothetical protein
LLGAGNGIRPSQIKITNAGLLATTQLSRRSLHRVSVQAAGGIHHQDRYSRQIAVPALASTHPWPDQSQVMLLFRQRI